MLFNESRFLNVYTKQLKLTINVRSECMCRHKDTGKSRGFAFLAYEDQRSTVLAVDNLNGARIGDRTVTVDHVDNYKRKRAEVPILSKRLFWYLGRSFNSIISKTANPCS